MLVTIGLSLVFWTTAALGKTATACLPFPGSRAWWGAVGFVAVMVMWWHEHHHAHFLANDRFWLACGVAAAFEGILLWVNWRAARSRERMEAEELLRLLGRF